jgi:peptidoglycan hydrolase-like protein with peptidoglycan-binding domain
MRQSKFGVSSKKAIVWFTVSLMAVLLVGGAAVAVNAQTVTVDQQMYQVAASYSDLSVGSVGPSVQVLETFLQSRGYFPTTMVPDQVFDFTTAQALRFYQAQAHINNTGYFGPYTRAHMMIVLWFRIHGFSTPFN